MSRILVTGGAGFVGRALCPALLQSGHQVRITSRSPASQPPQNGIATVAIGNIGPDTDWTWALENIDAVVHLAGRAHIMQETEEDPLKAFRFINVAGTQRLAEAALQHGIKRLVFVSSIKVHGEKTDGEGFSEADTPTPGDPYGQSKWEAEQALCRVAQNKNLEVVILRPPLIYGPHVMGNFKSLLNVCSKKLPLPLGSVQNQRSLIFVGNLVAAITQCLEHDKAAGETFVVSDGENMSTAELIRRIAAALQVPPRLVPITPKFLKLAGQLVGRQAMIARLTESLTVDSSKICTLLGWKPPHSVIEGLEQTAAWFRSSR
jgi:nucleoside-diphosphate-sugar epimerase